MHFLYFQVFLYFSQLLIQPGYGKNVRLQHPLTPVAVVTKSVAYEEKDESSVELEPPQLGSGEHFSQISAEKIAVFIHKKYCQKIAQKFGNVCKKLCNIFGKCR